VLGDAAGDATAGTVASPAPVGDAEGVAEIGELAIAEDGAVASWETA
jgi:hypothetical protein